MGCFDNFNPAAVHAVPITRHNQAREWSGPVVLDSFGHQRRGFACANDDSPAFWWRWQKGRNTQQRRSSAYRRIEHLPQFHAWLDKHGHYLAAQALDALLTT